jgi:hypothetical protein
MRKLYKLFAFVIALLLLASITGNAAMQSHLNLQGQKQGQIKGENTKSKTNTGKPSKNEDIQLQRGLNMSK